MTDSGRLLVPIGQFGGTIRGTESDRTTVTVRRGHDLWSMEPEPGRLWLDAHGRLDELETAALTRAGVLGPRRDDPAPGSVVAALEYLTGTGDNLWPACEALARSAPGPATGTRPGVPARCCSASRT